MMASFASFSSSVWNLDRYGWILSLIQLFWFRFSYLFPFFLFYLASKKLFSLKLWVVNLIILRCLPFFMPSIGWTLPHALWILFYPAQLHLWLPRITLLPFVSFFLGFQRPATNHAQSPEILISFIKLLRVRQYHIDDSYNSKFSQVLLYCCCYIDFAGKSVWAYKKAPQVTSIFIKFW